MLACARATPTAGATPTAARPATTTAPRPPRPRSVAGMPCSAEGMMSEREVCRQCGTAEPMIAKQGWLELRYSSVPGVFARFCGGLCAAQWMRAAQERLLDAVRGDEPARPPAAGGAG